jgi:cation transport ATPase
LTAGVAASSAKAGPGTLAVVDDRVFGPSGEALARCFAGRVLRFGEVRSLSLDPARATATLSYRLSDGDADAFLSRLADAVAGGDEALEEAELPLWPDGEPVTLHRHPGIVSTIEILSLANGRLDARHPAIARDPALAHRVENALRVVPGVISATATSAKAALRVRFDPRAVAAPELIRLAEAALIEGRSTHTVPSPEPVDFGLANASVGIAAVGEFVLPLVTPVTAGMLVLSNIETVGAAAHQLRDGKIGLPLLYTSIVGATLVSGQFLSAALMFWFFRFWEHRYREDLEIENKALLDATVRVPEEARMVTADGLLRVVPRREIAAGQRVRALTGETVPVDALVLAGAALMDETALHGPPASVRRVTGDRVLAGSKLLAGALDLEVVRTGNETRAAKIAQALIETTVPESRTWTLNQPAEDFADRVVAPTLLAAGAGLIVGGATTAGAILRPDYATGIGLAVPLETVRDVKLAMRYGSVVRSGNAFERLATTSWILLDDHEALHRADCDVAEMRIGRLDEARLLPAAAAAGMWFGDERGPALSRACRDRGLIVRRADLREINGDGVAIGYGGHVVRLRGRSVCGSAAPPPLIVEVDGVEAAGVRFRRNGRLEAATAVRQLQRGGLCVFLASAQAEDAVALLARQLGVDRHGAGMSLDSKIRILRDLRRQQAAVAFVGDCLAEAPAAREAHVSIALGGADAPVEAGLGRAPADIVLLGPSIVPLPSLCALARDSAKRMERARYAVMAPNLLCVAGAFAFGLTGMAAVIISNIGTSMVYNRAKRSLRMSEKAGAVHTGAALDADDDTALARPTPFPSEGVEMRTVA